MIDIIIPIYNTPINDIERCLESILNQTFKDYKVYIIDDGSNNEVKTYLDNYVKEKDNFIVKHISNKGISHARNMGIEISNSKYIAFVDSDDTITPKFLEEALTLIEDNNLDLIIGGYNEIKDNKVIRTRLSLPGLHIYEEENKILFLEKLLSGKTNELNKEINDCPTGRIYTRLFRRESIKGIKFNQNIKISEDTLFMIDYVNQDNIVGIIDKVWYNYYKNNYSVSSGANKQKLIGDIEDFIKEIEARKSNEKDIRIKKAYEARINKARESIEFIKSI